jgi:hypothetical protein
MQRACKTGPSGAELRRAESVTRLVNRMPDRRSPVQARAVRTRLRRLAASTGLRRPGCFASKRSWLFVSEIAPISTERRGGSVAWRALRPFF